MWSIKCFIIFYHCLTVCDATYKNLYGDELQTCSQDGMALTGFTRTGKCVTKNDDKGSHHICIDISSANGGNFCDVTGQSDWCSQESQCSEDSDTYCPIQNWCVCQWAFASYIENAGGCSKIQDIVCESINMEAYKAYKKKMTSSRIQEDSKVKIQNAIDCLESRCGYSNAMKTVALSVAATSVPRKKWAVLASFAVISLIFVATYRSYNKAKDDKSAVLIESDIGSITA